MSFRLGAAAQFLLPQKLSCRIVYRLARSEQRWLKSLLIAGFMKLYRVDLSEAESEDPGSYRCFNDFFVRTLKAGARPIVGDDSTIVSPVDGTLTEFGRIDADRLLQAKGMSYSLRLLLGEDAALLRDFDGGGFMTIYLAPHNYHRVHAPLTGQLDRGRYIPGRRFSVNAATASAIGGLFCRNERVSLWLSSRVGYAVVVMIGALNVASLTTALTGEIASGPERLLSPDEPPTIERGTELGRFNLGSTVVMVFPRGTVAWLETLAAGQSVRMGEALGRITTRGPERRGDAP